MLLAKKLISNIKKYNQDNFDEEFVENKIDLNEIFQRRDQAIIDNTLRYNESDNSTVNEEFLIDPFVSSFVDYSNFSSEPEFTNWNDDFKK